MKVCVTLAAASKLPLPDCEAVMEHVPVPVRWMVAPETVHAPPAVYETGRPEPAVAARVKSGSPSVWSGRGPNVIAWLALTTVCELSARS